MKLKQQTVRLSRRTLTAPPYLVGLRDCQGRTIAGDKNDEWLHPACHEMYRVLKKDALLKSGQYRKISDDIRKSGLSISDYVQHNGLN